MAEEQSSAPSPISTAAKKPKFLLKVLMKIVILGLLALVMIIFYLVQTKPKFISVPTPVPTISPQPTEEISPSPIPTLIPTSGLTPGPIEKPGWETYKDTQLGFEISFPEKYKIQEDKYGWPKAILLLYGGGQSYDLAVEVWDKPSEYENKYKAQKNLVVKQIGDKYLTFLNMNYKEEVDEIIATFKATD